MLNRCVFFFSSRRRHTRLVSDWSSDVCSSDLFIDFDNDGLLDIFVANGHVYPSVDQRDWGTTWAQRPQLFRNLDGTKFQEIPPASGSGLADVIPARGAAFGDLFNDGHTDVVLNNMDSAPVLLRNVVKNDNHWLTFKLVGGGKSPRDAIRSEEHTSELQSLTNLVCRLLLEKKKKRYT